MIEKLAKVIPRDDAEVALAARDRAEFLNYVRFNTGLGVLRIMEVHRIVSTLHPSGRFLDALDAVDFALDKPTD
jgi:hypothetical protein